MDWSFSGCGFLGVYHIGAASCLKEYSPQLVGRIYGASGGALAGCCLLCNSCLGEATSKLLNLVAKARSRSLGPFHPSFNLNKVLRHELHGVLPKNAHELASGRLFVSLTRVSDAKNVLISQFDTKDDLIDALLCSSFIPFYCGFIPPTYKGIRYLDGGITDNQPIFDENTITISPFAGEQDICPMDNSHSFFCFDITNTNVQINSANMYRLCCALFPPQPEVLNDVCKQGFDDALRFLQRKSLMSCIRCLSVKAKLRVDQIKDRKRGFVTRRRSWLEKTKAAIALIPAPPLRPAILDSGAADYQQLLPPPISCTNRLIINSAQISLSAQTPVPKTLKKHKHGNGRCRDCRVPLVQQELDELTKGESGGKRSTIATSSSSLSQPRTRSEPNTPLKRANSEDALMTDNMDISDAAIEAAFIKSLPVAVSNAFKVACENMDKGLLNLLLKLPPIKLFAYYVNVCLFPVDMFLHLSLRFFDWIPYLLGDMAWIFSHFIPLLRLFLKKIYDSKQEAKASLSCEIDVSQMNFYQDYKEAVEADIQDFEESNATEVTAAIKSNEHPTKMTTDSKQLEEISHIAKECASLDLNDAAPVKSVGRQKNVNFALSLKWPKLIDRRLLTNRRSSWYGTGITSTTPEDENRLAKSKVNGAEKIHHSSHPCLSDPLQQSGQELDKQQDPILGKNEAIMSYYYDDNKGNLKITEIYDVTNKDLPVHQLQNLTF